MILPADAAGGAVAPATIRPVSPASKPLASATAVGAVAQAVRQAPGRVGLLLGGEALRAASLDIAGGIAAAHDARLFAGMFFARAERGRGRIPVARIPYPVDQAVEALRDIDVLVLVGDAEPVAFFAYPGKPSRLARDGCVSTLAPPGHDLRQALEALAAELGVARTRAETVRQPPPEPGKPKGLLTDDAIAMMVAALLPDQAIVCDEGITAARRFFSLSEFAAPHDYLMITGGAIGIGIPLATGAAIACPGRKVVTLQADGSGMYTVQGLWTQARENLDVLTIIFSNRAYAILQGELRALGVTETGRNAERMMSLRHPDLDWVSLAGGMGVEAARATTCEEFLPLLAMALRRPGPFLIEAVI